MTALTLGNLLNISYILGTAHWHGWLDIHKVTSLRETAIHSHQGLESGIFSSSPALFRSVPHRCVFPVHAGLGMEFSQALVARTMENVREPYQQTRLTNRLLEATGGIAQRCQEAATDRCQGAQLEGVRVPDSYIALHKRSKALVLRSEVHSVAVHTATRQRGPEAQPWLRPCWTTGSNVLASLHLQTPNPNTQP